MDFLHRFSGQGTPTPGGELVANPRAENPLGLQLLFDATLDLDADALALALRTFHPDLADAKVDLHVVPRTEPPAGHPENDSPPAVLGLFGWGRHVVKLIGFNAKMPPDVVETCVKPAHFSEELKQLAYDHAAHALLYYAGYERDPFEQYVALGAVAAALARFGAVTTLNEHARTAIPAPALLPQDDEPDALDMLRQLPIPLIYGGFVKLEVEGEPGVWMRTCGNDRLGLPDLAIRAGGHHEGQFTFFLFSRLLDYLRESGKSFAPGHTMQVGEDTFLRVRAPAEAEWYLETDGEMLVCERIAADEANPPGEG
jgi:hypothetical protein